MEDQHQQIQKKNDEHRKEASKKYKGTHKKHRQYK
jgi:hypothetical protein